MNKDNYKPLTGGSNSNTRLNQGTRLNQSSTIKKITLKKKKYNRKKQHTHRKYPTKRKYHTKKKYPVKKKTITKKKYRGGRPKVNPMGKRIYPGDGKPYTYDEFKKFYWTPFPKDESAAEKAWSDAKEVLDMTGVPNRWSLEGYEGEEQNQNTGQRSINEHDLSTDNQVSTELNPYGYAKMKDIKEESRASRATRAASDVASRASIAASRASRAASDAVSKIGETNTDEDRVILQLSEKSIDIIRAGPSI